MIQIRRLLCYMLTGSFAFATQFASADTCGCPKSGVSGHVCIRAPENDVPLKYDQLYAIEITGREVDSPLERFKGSATHLVMVTTEGMAEASYAPFTQEGDSSSAPSSGTMPESALILVRPFTFGWAPNGTLHVAADTRNQLRKLVIVNGDQPLTLVGSISLMTQPHRVLTLENKIQVATKRAEPFFAFVSKMIPAAGAVVEGAKGLTDLLKDAFSPTKTEDSAVSEALGETRGGDVQNTTCEARLSVGRFEVRTAKSAVTVKVYPVSSLVQSAGTGTYQLEFGRYLAETVNERSAAFKDAFLSTRTADSQREIEKRKCLVANTALWNVGLRNDLDRGVALLRLALNEGLQKEEILECMPSELALELTSVESTGLEGQKQLEDQIWLGASQEQRFTQDDVSNVRVPPWQYCKVIQPKSWGQKLSAAAQGFNSNGTLDPYYFSETVLLIDLTTQLDSGKSNNVQTTSLEELRTELISRGIEKLQCHYLDVKADFCASYACVGGAKNDQANTSNVVIFPYISEGKIGVMRLLKDPDFVAMLSRRVDVPPTLDRAQPSE